MEYVAFAIAIIVIGLFILPTRNKIVSKQHLARPENCTCPEYNKFSVRIDYDCPVHGDWADPLYPVEDIKKSNMSEREEACHKAGLYVNQLYRDREE